MYKIFYNFIFIMLLAACGKKVAPSKNAVLIDSGQKKPLSSSLIKFIQKQSVTCEDEKLCPENVAKIVVVDRDRIRYCTASLVSEDMMMTSSTCLPDTLKAPGLDCSQNIFAIFPKTHLKQAQRVGCKRILDSNSNNDVDAALWKNDFTFFSLSERLERQVSVVSSNGMIEGKKYTAWKIDYQTDTSSVLISERCVPIYNSYANPFATNKSSPMMPVYNCSIKEGNSGAPLFDELSNVVGIYSEKLDSDVVFYISMSNLLSEPMLAIHFVSNFSCAKIPGEPNYELDKECFKDINRVKLDKLRSKYLTSNEVHKENMQRIISKLEDESKFFKWQMIFKQDFRNNYWQAHIVRPKCFFDIDNWIDDFTRIGGFIKSYIEVDLEFNNYEIKTKLNRFLRPVSIVEKNNTKKYQLIFNPKSAYNDKSTYLKVNSTLFGRDLNLDFEKVTDTCE